MSTDPREIAEYPTEGEPARDGIEEDDHAIPLWFNVTFLGTIVFACIYIPYYILGGWSQEGQWAAEVERAEKKYAAVRGALPSENPYRGDADPIEIRPFIGKKDDRTSKDTYFQLGR